MAAPLQFPACVAGCNQQTLPTVSFSDSCPEINPSEIEEIYFTEPDAAPFTDVSQPGEWATRLSQTANTAGSIRRLNVVGDKPAAAEQRKTISKQREVFTDATHTLNAEIDETNDTNYDAMREMQCQPKWRIWYKTRGGKNYGGNEGILANISIRDVLGRGDEHEKFVLTATWRSKFDPPRVTSPI